MEQTLTYSRKHLIAAFEKSTVITTSVKIDTVVEAIQIINHLIKFLEITDLNPVNEEFITPDYNKDTVKIRFTAKKDKLSHAEFISTIKVFNDYLLSCKV